MIVAGSDSYGVGGVTTYGDLFGFIRVNSWQKDIRGHPVHPWQKNPHSALELFRTSNSE